MPPLLSERFLSIIVVNSPCLPFEHLPLLVSALNQQSSQNFNTYWIEQSGDISELQALLQNEAQFSWQLLHPGLNYPVLDDVICWELIRPFAEIMESANIAPYFTYLHKECLPRTDFVAELEQRLPELAREYGAEFIAALHQLRSPLQLQDLSADWPKQLSEASGRVWKSREAYIPYCQNHPAVWEQNWSEDAFVMPTALARRLHLYSGVRSRLYFQDMFNILAWLPDKPYCQNIRWLRLRDAVIYHLQHPRLFKEYSRHFLDHVREHPEIFGHLALYDMAHSPYGYHEPFQQGQRIEAPGLLNFFYGVVLKSERGTLQIWSRELDGLHHLDPEDLPLLKLSAEQRFEASAKLSRESQTALQVWQQSFQDWRHFSTVEKENFEQEGIRLWLQLQQELAGQIRVHYQSLKQGQIYRHLGDYPRPLTKP